MLYEVDMKQPLTDRLVGQRRREGFKRPPVLSIGPFLVRVEFIEI